MANAHKLALFSLTIFALMLGAPPVDACSINAAGSCGGSACDKGETCKKTDEFTCECVENKAVAGVAGLSDCARANATLNELLGSSSEEIRLQAAVGLLENGCAAPAVSAAPGCVEPANQQYKACRTSCATHSPGLQECLDGCADIFGAVLERCAEGPNVKRNDCHDCLSDCSEGKYECYQDCRDADPWDPDCYDDCDDIDCSEECKDECS